MSLEKKITESIKEAMKARDTLKLETLRGVKSQFKYYQVDNKIDVLTEEDVLTVLTKQVKQRTDAISEYEKAGREDLAEKERKEKDILQAFLPKQLSDEEIEELVVAAIKEVDAKDKKDMGKLMKVLMPKVKGRADGKVVNQFVLKNLPSN